MLKRKQMLEALRKFTETHVSCSIRNVHDAQDVKQDVYMTYLEMSKRYKELIPEDFLRIAKVACRNKVRDYIRFRVRKCNYRPERTYTQVNVDQLDARNTLQEIKDRSCGRTQTVLHFMERGLEPIDICNLFEMPRSGFRQAMRQARSVICKEDYKEAFQESRLLHIVPVGQDDEL